MLNFLRLTLAAWRLASLLVNEDGPADVFARLRHRAGVRYDKYAQPYGTNIISSALLCLWCTSVWTALLIVALDKVAPALVNVLAVSAAAIGWHKKVMS